MKKKMTLKNLFNAAIAVLLMGFGMSVNAQGFNLISPADQAALTVEGNSSNQINIIWGADTLAATTYNWVLLDGLNDTVVTIPSNNLGVDTMLTLTNGAIDGLFQSLNVPLNTQLFLSWYVASSNGTLLNSSDTFDIDLTRGSVSSPFNLTSPPNATALTVAGNGTNLIDVTWQNSGAGVTYAWWLDVAGGNFSNPIIVVPSNNGGNDTALTLDFATIDAVLAGAGVPLGGIANLQWTVSAFAGNDTLLSTSVNTIDLTRGAIASAFDLTSPANGAALTVEGNGTNEIDITWKNSGNGVTYAWWLDVVGGNFSNPILVVGSNNMGMDTALTLDFATIDAVLAGAGVPLGGTANLQWAVSAFAGNDTLLSTSVNTIDLTRGAIANAFDLTSPANAAALTVEGNATNEIDITWENSGNGVTYAWWLDVAGGNFSNPIIVVPSNNMGMDTALTLDFATIDAVLAGAGVPVGGIANLQWAVSAFSGNDTLLSTSVNTIDLTRGAIANAFDLTSPPAATLLNVTGNGSNQVDITWENAGNGVTYAWWLDVAGGNFSNPIIVVPSNNMGMDTALTLDLATIDAVLGSAGVNLGDTANLQWAVSAFAGNDTLISTNVNTIDLVRGLVADPFNLTSPPTGFSANISGLGNTQVDITWENSGNGVTYAWWLDLAGGNFSNPIIVLPSNNMGMDTALTLDFATIDAVLAGAGVAIGQTANLQWAVSAFAGNDTLLSTNVNTINLTRGNIFTAFDLLSPANNATLNIQGPGATTADITWNASAMNSSYTWMLDIPSGDFSNPIVAVSSNNAGADTMLTLDFTTIDAVLAGAGVAVGSSATLKWTVVATAGTDSAFANQEFNITLNRNGLLSGFDLRTPANGAAYTNQGLGTQEVNITWNNVDPTATYTWSLFAGGNLVIAIPTGTDTALVLDFATIDAVLAGAGVGVGATASLTWDVEADINGTMVTSANGPFSLGILRGTVISDFDLLTPPNGFAATIQGDPTQTVGITWNSSSLGNATYKWMLDLQGGDFTNPIVVVPSGNSGSDTSLVLDFGTITSVLTGAGVTPGNSVDLIWTVRANGGGDSLSAAAFDLNLTRGILTSSQNIEKETNFVTVYPNPANEYLTVSGISSKSGIEFSIMDITGKIVKRGLEVNNTSNVIIPTSDLNNGIYLLSLHTEGLTTLRRITISH